VITLTTAEVDELLTKLCIDLGFCLPPKAIARFQTTPPADVDAFTDAVFIAEGLDPLTNRKLRGEVRAVVDDAFARAQENKKGTAL
jgi:hypothetical protein